MKHIRRLLSSFMVLTIMATALLGSSSIASAAGDTATGSATLSPGSLAVNSVANFTFTGTLNAAQQTLSTSFIVNVADPTETSAGWHLQAAITPLVKSGPVTLAASPKITGNSLIAAVNGTAPTNGTSYGTAIDLSATAATIFAANASTGMGQSNLTFTTDLVVPATAVSGNYAATLTVTIVSGP